MKWPFGGMCGFRRDWTNSVQITSTINCSGYRLIGRDLNYIRDLSFSLALPGSPSLPSSWFRRLYLWVEETGAWTCVLTSSYKVWNVWKFIAAPSLCHVRTEASLSLGYNKLAIISDCRRNADKFCIMVSFGKRRYGTWMLQLQDGDVLERTRGCRHEHRGLLNNRGQWYACNLGTDSHKQNRDTSYRWLWGGSGLIVLLKRWRMRGIKGLRLMSDESETGITIRVPRWQMVVT